MCPTTTEYIQVLTFKLTDKNNFYIMNSKIYSLGANTV